VCPGGERNGVARGGRVDSRARARDVTVPEQEGEGGSGAHGFVRRAWGRGAAWLRSVIGVGVAGAVMPRWGKGTGGANGCRNEQTEASVHPDV
jgi:hypothetical protein